MSPTALRSNLYTTGDLARLTGNTLRTVRYYEELGLLTPVPREDGAHRHFTEQDVERLRAITDLRAIGLSLEEVARVVRLPEHAPDRPQRVREARAMLDDQLELVRQRMATLKRVEEHLAGARRVLDSCMACPSLPGGEQCPACDCRQRDEGRSLLSVVMEGDRGGGGPHGACG